MRRSKPSQKPSRTVESRTEYKSTASPPGAIITGRRLAMLEKAALAKKIGPEEMKNLFLKQAGLERFGQPEEIADLIAFVVSPRAHWLTGTVLRMDGGEVKEALRPSLSMALALRRSLQPRHVSMIAVGGTIGAGRDRLRRNVDRARPG